MPRGKNSSIKKTQKNGSPRKPEEIEKSAVTDEVEEFAPKIKEVIEIEEREDVILPVDKMSADPLLETVTPDGLEADELSLDEEEIDPFGDKWEA